MNSALSNNSDNDSSKDQVSPTKSGKWVDEITDSETEEVSHSSNKVNKSNSDDDLYLEIIKKDIKGLPDVTRETFRESDREIITIEDKNSSEDEKVNQYLDDIERKLEADIKNETPPDDKDDWKLVDYFKDIICVKVLNVTDKSKSLVQIADKKTDRKKRRKNHDLPSRNDKIEKKEKECEGGMKRRRKSVNSTLSDGEIISDEELILSDFSLSPEPGHKSDRCSEFNRRDIDPLKVHPRELSRKYTRKDKIGYKHRNKLKGNSYDSSNGGSDSPSPIHERKENKRIVQIVPESSTSRNADHHWRSHRSNNRFQSDHKRRHCNSKTHQDGNRKRTNEHSKSKRHCRCESKREGRSKLPSDYFDEDKYHGSDKSRIRNLKKKYDEYLKYAKKYKNDDEDNKHIEKFAEMRSKLKEDIFNKQTLSTNETSSIDYKKEEEKFLRSLETYLEIKKKQEKSITSGVQLSTISSSNKEYNPDISSEEEEYVPEKFTPEDMSVSNVEEYDPCSLSNISDASFTYEPTKIDEYEPVIPRIDEEYCPMPVEKTVQLTYNPTKKFSNNIGTQAMVSKQPAQGWMKTAIRCPTMSKHLIPNSINKQSRMNIMKNKSRTKVISKNTVFIGNIVNPFALNDKNQLISCKKLNAAPSITKNIDKSKIMSKLVHEKLLEIEKKKLQLLEEIHRKKLLKIKEKCDEVALKNLEEKKSNLMLELYRNTKTELNSVNNPVRESDGMDSTFSPEKTNNPAGDNFEYVTFNNIEIKREKTDSKLPPDNITEKLSVLQIKKANLMVEINRKLSINSEKINKEKADVASKLETLEKNRSALLAQVKRKEALAVVEKEKKDINSSTMSSTTIATVNIKQEKETLYEVSALKNFTVSHELVETTKKLPVINEKLNKLEQEKSKLMAQIAAKSNQVGIVSVKNEQPKLKVNRPEEVNEKLVKLAKEKEKLLSQIEQKKIKTEPHFSVSDMRVNTDLLTSSSLIKKEKEENSSVSLYENSIQLEKDNNDVTPTPKVVMKEEPKQNPKSLSSSNNLAFKINELEKQKAELMLKLANKLPVNGKTSIVPEIRSKETQRDSVCQNAGVGNKTNPIAIVELASQVKLKVSRQLSEITKKKMELMKQINSKSLKSTESVETSTNSSKSSCSTASSDVQDKLLELEKNKLKLLIEIKRKSNQKKSDKENMGEKRRDQSNTDVIKKVKTSNLPTSSKLYDKEENINVQTSHSHRKLYPCAVTHDEQFKIPEIPQVKNVLKNPKRVNKNKTITPKIRKRKYQKPKLKTVLSKKKCLMLKRFRKLNSLKGLWTNLDSTVFGQNEDGQNGCTSVSKELGVQSSKERGLSCQFNEKDAENLVPPDLSTSSSFSIQKRPASSKHDLFNCNEAQFELKLDVNNEPLVLTHDAGEVEVLETPLPVFKQLEFITIDDDEDGQVSMPPKHTITNDDVIMEENLNSNEEVANNEFITLKVIKIEKPWDFEDEKNNGGDGKQENIHGEKSRSHQSNENNENNQSERTFEKKQNGNNAPVKDDGISTNLLSFDSDQVENFDRLNKNDTNCIMIPNDDFSLGDLQDIVHSVDFSYYKNKNKLIASTLRKYNKYSSSSTFNIPVVSKLILNNKRKLIVSADICNKNSNYLKFSNAASSSVFKLVHMNPLRPSPSGYEKNGFSKNEPVKKSKQIMERLVNLKSNTRKKQKIDNRKIQNLSEHQTQKYRASIERKSRKNPLLYKFYKISDQFKRNNGNVISINNSVIKTKNEKNVQGHINSLNPSKYKLTNIDKDTIGHKSSVISKFRLVNKFNNTPNPKFNNYKNLPLVIRRQVINRFKLSNTNTPNKYSTCKKKSTMQLGRSNYKILKSVERSNQFNSSKSITSRKNSKTKSKYKIYRLLSGHNSSVKKQQGGKLKSTKNIVTWSTASRKYHLNNKVAQRYVTTKPTQLKINHLVSKYKMIRFSNQRERNKINLSQRVQDSIYPNRTMRVIKLHGASYKVSSRSLKRNVSLCLDNLPSKLTTHSISPLAVTRRSSKAQLSGNIFSNRHIIGRQHLTSSRLRSLAVLTSRLRKNNVQMSLPRCSTNPRPETSSNNRDGYSKGCGHIGGRYKMNPSRRANDGHDAKQKTYGNLSYTSRAEELKCRRSCRHRAKQCQRRRMRKYSPPPSPSPDPGDDSSESALRYFASDNPRSNIRPDDEECVETVIPRRVRKVGALPGFIPL